MFFSHSYPKLMQVLLQKLSEGNHSVFHTDTIFYQAKGIRNRLPVDMAELSEQGIFSGCEFQHLWNLEEWIAKKTQMDMPAEPNPVLFQYALYNALNDQGFRKNFPDQAQYYGDDKDNQKRMRLAMELHGLFSSYTQYRPDWLEQWTNNKLSTNNNFDEQWQSRLWHIITRKEPAIARHAQLKSSFLQQLKDEEVKKRIKAKIPRLFFYGISSLSPHQADIIKELSAITEVHLFAYGLPETVTLNPFVENFGAIGKDFRKLLCEKGIKLKTLDKPEIQTDSVLKRIQEHIATGNNEHITSYNPEKDLSIQIHSCYTEVRELEALYHYLLHLMEKDSNLKARNIAVLIPDLDTYAPYIRSVFGCNDYTYNFPYHIERESFSGEGSPAAMFNRFLALSKENFSSEQILQLLENKFISEAFVIHDLEKIRSWLDEAAIRFGIEGSANKEDETYIPSFYYGLMRLIYSFALGENSQYPGDGDRLLAPEGEEIYPVGTFQGSTDLMLLCRFKAFVDALRTMLKERENKRSLHAWIQYLKEFVLDGILYPTQDTEEDAEEREEPAEEQEEESPTRYFERMLMEFTRDIPETQDEPLSWENFNLLFSGYISAGEQRSHRISGGITFAGWSSMQGLNYDVVALLGMDYSALPRKFTPRSFDLIARDTTKRTGDPNIREQDKYTFLQNLLSAGKHLLISYKGRSAKDNSKRPPGIFTEQLLDYMGIAEKEKEEPKPQSHIFVQHPLHAFSNKYNKNDYPRLISYKVKNGEQPQKDKLTANPTLLNAKEFDFSTIELYRLINFFKDPFKLYLQKKLNYYISEETESLSEMEPFVLSDNLHIHSIKQFLMEDPSEEKCKNFIREYKHKGILPLAKVGFEAINNIEEEIEDLRARYRILKKDKERTIEKKSLSIDNHILVADYHLYDNHHISFCTSKKDSCPKYLVANWIKHLFINASRGETNSTMVLYWEEKKETKEYMVLKPISKDEARQKLKKMIEYFIAGHSTPMPFDLNLLFEFNYRADHYQTAIDLDIVSEKDFDDNKDRFKKLLDVDSILASIQ